MRRIIVAGAAVTLYTVGTLKTVTAESGAQRRYVSVDGGMSELIRPSHYGGFHKIEPVAAHDARPPTVVDVVGPICETGDFLAREREIPLPEPGELLAVRERNRTAEQPGAP